MGKIKLTSACNITTGKLDANAAEKEGKYPYFTCAPEPLRINSYAFDCDAILLAGNNAAGNFHCQRYKGKFNAYQRTYVITAKDGYDIDYIYYNLLINLDTLKKLAQGSQTKFLTMNILDKFEIEELSLKEQIDKIKILKLLDQKISFNKKIQQSLDIYLKNTYSYVFNQMQLNYINIDNKNMVYNNKIKKYIPNTWKIQNMYENDLFSVIKTGIKTFDGEKKYLATANVNENNIEEGSNITYEHRESRANMQPINNSVWFAKMKNSIKHMTITEECKYLLNNNVFSTGFLGLKCDYNSLTYIHSFINSAYFEKVKDALAHGATQEAINNDDLKQIKIVVPDKNTLDNFTKITMNQLKELSILHEENIKLNGLLHYLLPIIMFRK